MLLQEPDLQDFLNAFNKSEVKYLIVGGAAVILHGYARTTVDLDIWVEKSEENYLRICKAFKLFGMPIFDMTYENFFNNPDIDVFTFGRPPVCIDLMLAVKGLEFEQAFNSSVKMEMNGISFSVVSKADLIVAKKSVGRYKDLDDAEQLSKGEKNAT
jgi:predicted nucleotidyltransferase